MNFMQAQLSFTQVTYYYGNEVSDGISNVSYLCNEMFYFQRVIFGVSELSQD